MKHPVLRAAPNGIFTAYWSENRRSCRKSMGTADPAIAQRRFADWLLRERASTGGAPATVEACWTLYKTRHVDLRVASPATLDAAWRVLRPHFGTALASSVNQRLVDTYVARRTSGALGRAVKPHTVRRELSALSACLAFCARPGVGLIPSAPRFTSPDAGAPRDRWLRSDEIQRLLTAAATSRHDGRLTRVERFLWLALETSARAASIVGLTWDRVDLETGVVHYGDPALRRTKKRRVSVPISAALRPVIERAYAERTGPFVLDAATPIWRAVQDVAARAGFARIGAVATGISPHTLRHTAATHMVRRGVPLAHVSAVLGSTIAVVEKVYAHHCPQHLRGAVNAISAGDLYAIE